MANLIYNYLWSIMSCKISFPSSTFPYQSRTIIYSLFSLYSRWEIRVFNLWIQSAKLSSQGWARLLRVYDDVVSSSDWNGSCSIIHPQFSSSCPVQPCPSEQLIPSTLNLEQLNNYTFMLLPPFLAIDKHNSLHMIATINYTTIHLWIRNTTERKEDRIG